MIGLEEGFDASLALASVASRWTVLDSSGIAFGEEGQYGGYALRCDGGGAVKLQSQLLALSDADDVIVTLRYRAVDPTSAEGLIILKDTANQEMIALETEPVAGGFFFRVRCGDRTLATTRVYAEDEWTLLALKVHFATSDTGTVELRVNQHDVAAEVTGVRTCASGTAAVGHLRMDIVANSGGYADVDDVVLVDASGDRNNDWLGDVVVVAMWPTADSALPGFNGWTGSLPHYQLVDEGASGAMDGDTSFLLHDGSSDGAIEFFRMSPTGRFPYEVFEVAIHVDARLVSAGSATLFGYVNSEGTPVLGDALTLTSTTYVCLTARAPLRTNGRFWTRDHVAGAEFGIFAADSTAVRMSRFHIEVVARAPAVVDAEAMDPDQGSQFFANWQGGMPLDTSWLTDVSKDKDTLAADRRALNRKPVRTASYELTGMDRSQTLAMMNTQARRGINETTGLVQPDRARLLQDASAGATTLYVDTRWRRFFPGQRCCVAKPGPNTVITLAEWVIIKHVFEDRLVLEDATANAHEAGVQVYPAFAAEVLMDSEASLITGDHGLFQVRLLERKGSFTLPSLWEGTEFGHCQYYDGLPIFEQRLNWAQGIRIGLSRAGTRDTAGKSSIVSAEGERPAFGFTLLCDEFSREAIWPVLQFFDSRRGRAHPWWIANPARAYEPVASSASSVDVEKHGNLADLQALYTHLWLQSATSGASVPVEISSVVDIGAYWRINTVESTVPGDCIAVRPLHKVLFTTDTIREQWANDEQCSLSLPAEETFAEGDVQVADLTIPEFIEGTPAAIPNLMLWFDANQNVFDYDPVLDAYRRSNPWPAHYHKNARWSDARLVLPDVMRLADFPPYTLADSSVGGDLEQPYIARFHHPWLNRGHRIHIGGPMAPGWHASSVLQVGEKQLWNNTLGMTIVIVHVGGATAFTAVRRILRLRNLAAGGDLLSWDGKIAAGLARVQAYATPGVVDPNLAIDHATFETAGPAMTVLRWVPGETLKVYRAGVLLGQTAITLAGFPSVLGFDADDWLIYFDIDQPPARGVADAQYLVRPMLNSMLSFQRALSNAELNSLGVFFSQNYDVTWAPL